MKYSPVYKILLHVINSQNTKIRWQDLNLLLSAKLSENVSR